MLYSPAVISASRRTDIPAFYGPWFKHRLDEGFCDVFHPFSRQHKRVSLLPESVYAFVFWSKNFRPFWPVLDALDRKGYPVYFFYTLTGMPQKLEPGVPPVSEGIETFRALSERYSPAQVQWRFDPILLTDVLTPVFYRRRFEEIAIKLAGFTERCYISFALPYRKALRRFQKAHGPEERWRDPPAEEKQALALDLARVGGRYGIALYSCCDNSLVLEGIEKGRCVDYPRMAELFGGLPVPLKVRPTRKGCGCYQSTDIGTYGTCQNRCLYCYAC